MLTIETNHFGGGACLTGKGAGGKASLQQLLEELQNPADATIGDGTAAASLTIDKDGAAAGDLNLKSDGVLRGRIRLNSSEALVIEVFNDSEVSQGTVTIGTDGAVTLSKGLTISSGALTVTGISMVGLETYVTLDVGSLVGTGVYGFASPVAGTITNIQTRLKAPLTTGDATLTGKIGNTAITGGVITITQSGSAIGDIDSASPSAANTVAVGSNVSFTVGGTNDAAVGATVTVTIRRSA